MALPETGWEIDTGNKIASSITHAIGHFLQQKNTTGVIFSHCHRVPLITQAQDTFWLVILSTALNRNFSK